MDGKKTFGRGATGSESKGTLEKINSPWNKQDAQTGKTRGSHKKKKRGGKKVSNYSCRRKLGKESEAGAEAGGIN